MKTWKNPCILECLLVDSRKSKHLTRALENLGLEIELVGNNWFNIIKGK